MSRGDGGVIIVVTVYVTIWTSTGLAPLAFGLAAGALLVVWTVGLVGVSAVASAILFAKHWRTAVTTRNWLWLSELVAVPIAATWIGWLGRDGFRDFWVDQVAASNTNPSSTLLFGALMFVFFLVCFPISIWGMGIGVDAGFAGTGLRLLVTGLTPLVIAVGSWTALVMNTVDPVQMQPPQPGVLQTVCQAAVREEADRALADVNPKDPTRTTWLQLGQITPGKPKAWNWRIGTATVNVAASVQWHRADQAGPVAENALPWTCAARWDDGNKSWAVNDVHEVGVPAPPR